MRTTTPKIAPHLAMQGYELITGFYIAGIDCPQLAQFGAWLTDNQATSTTAPIANSNTASFQDAVYAGVQSSPDGITAGELGPVLAQYGQKGSTIGTALGRLKLAGKVEKRGDLWFAMTGNGAAETKVDRRLTSGRTKRASGTRTSRSRAATGSGEQQQAMAATG